MNECFSDKLPYIRQHLDTIERNVILTGTAKQPAAKLVIQIMIYSKLTLERIFFNKFFKMSPNIVYDQSKNTTSRQNNLSNKNETVQNNLSNEAIAFYIGLIAGDVNPKVIQSLFNKTEQFKKQDLITLLLSPKGLLSIGHAHYVDRFPGRSIFPDSDQKKIKADKERELWVRGYAGWKETIWYKDYLSRHKRMEPVPNYIMAALKVIQTNPEQCASSYLEETSFTNRLFHVAAHSKKDINTFMKLYNIQIQDQKFSTFNDLFNRNEKGWKIQDPDDTTKICSPADCRMVVFPTIQESKKLWIKGKEFDIESLLGLGEFSFKYKSIFDNGSLCVARLAPCDSHSWCSPVSGLVIDSLDIPGYMLPTIPIVVQTVDVYTKNHRKIFLFQTQNIGYVLFIAIGSAFIGSIETKYKKNISITKGEQCGTFRYGGSTLILLFEPNRIKFLPQLLENSRDRIETYIQRGTTIASLLNDDDSQSQ